MAHNYRNRVNVHHALASPYPLPDGVVDTCVTSPPYWGKRDYQHPEQIGLEPTPEAYVAHLVQVFREVRRVLKPTGTLWLNLGDTYWGGKGRSGAAWSKHNGNQLYQQGQSWADYGQTRPQDRRHASIKAKDLVGIPWTVALALRADGWYLRSEVIWNKPNAMPEAVKDRPTVAHETLFLLTRAPHYYYDHVAVQEATEDDEVRNKRSVWTVPTVGYPGDHFAVFPEKLIVPCVLAGTSAHGNCAACGGPWDRVTVPVHDIGESTTSGTAYPEGTKGGNIRRRQQAARQQGLEITGARRTIGWRPSCRCTNAGLERPLVFDPFGGAGTTAVVAQAHGRDYNLQELNPAYVDDIQARLKAEFGMFHKAST